MAKTPEKLKPTIYAPHVQRARKSREYICRILINGRFVEGGETLEAFDCCLGTEEHAELMRLIAQWRASGRVD